MNHKEKPTTAWFRAQLQSNATIHHALLPEPPSYFGYTTELSQEHIHYKIHAEPNQDPTVMVIGGLHADETISSEILIHTILPNTDIPHVAIPVANPLAYMTGTRGWIAQNPDGSHAMIDLNRQFPLSTNPNNPALSLHTPEAMLLFDILEQFPSLGLLISIHEDPELGHPHNPGGIYLYDHPPHEYIDLEYWRIQHLFHALEVDLHHHGFPLFTGNDDLGNAIINGYVYQPAVQADTTVCNDRTFEIFAAHLATQEILPQDFRVITIEIPGGYSTEQKTEALAVITDTFLVPIIRKKGLLPK